MTWISTFPKIVLIISLILISSQSYAQKYEVYELNQVLNTTSKSKSVLEIDVERLRSLIFDLHPTVYFENQEIKQFEQDSPLKAEIFSNSTNLLTNEQMTFPLLELMVFKFASPADTSRKLDLSSFQQINNLRYIYIECSFNCNVTDLGKIFSNLGDIKVFYKIITQE